LVFSGIVLGFACDLSPSFSSSLIVNVFVIGLKFQSISDRKMVTDSKSKIKDIKIKT